MFLVFHSCGLTKDEVQKLYDEGGPEAYETSEIFFISVEVFSCFTATLNIIALLKFLYGLSVRFPASFLCLSSPVFFVHCPYKGGINRAKGVLTGLRPY